MFCCTLVYVHSSFAIILMGEERVGCFAWFVFLVSRDCCVAFPPMPWVCLRCVIVVFPDHTHLLLNAVIDEL